MSDDFLFIDIETRSACDLRKCGSYVYFEDPTTEVLLACYAIGDGPVRTWWQGDPCPPLIADHVTAGRLVSGWNVGGFERLAWNALLGPVHGWPVPTLEQYDDTAVAAAAMALPRALGQAAQALGTAVQKDDEGYRLMLQMSKPRRARKGEDADAIHWWDDPEKMTRLGLYCEKDVETERAIRKKLVPLSPAEREVYLFDQRMNDRGVRIDLDLVAAMQKIIATSKKDLDAEMRDATEGQVKNCTQASALAEWLSGELCMKVLSVDKNSISRLLALDDLPDHVVRALRARQEAAKGSTAKLTAMENAACADGRARGLHLYHGASTGRWSGRLIQCVTGEHEVLTPEGWRPIREAVGRCRIMQWDPNARRMSWADGEVNKFPAPALIAEIDNKSIRGRFTLDHRMPNVNSSRVVDWTPEMLLDVKRRDGFLVTECVEQPEAEWSDAQIRLLVAMQADGTFAAGRGRGPAVWRFKKDRKIERLRALLRQAGISYDERRNPCAPEVAAFRVRPDDVPNWLTKGFGPWVLSLSARQARLALREIALWDGYRHPKNGAVCIASPEKDQMEWVVTIAALAGRSASLTWYPERKSPRGCWTVYVRESKTATIRRPQVSVLPNDEPVYCPTVPGGYWLCRYDDRVYITGNTQNMPRGTGTVKDPEKAAPALLSGSADLVRILYDPPMNAVSDSLRACLVASPGHRLLAADYSSIEGRVTSWVAGEDWKLEAFRANDAGTGAGMYEVTAGGIFNVAPESIGKKDPRRQVGKTAELALGFAGGVSSFHAFAEVYHVDMEAAYQPLLQTSDPDTVERAEESHARWSEEKMLATDKMSRKAWIASEITKVRWREEHPATVACWDGLQSAIFDAVESAVVYRDVPYRKRDGSLGLQQEFAGYQPGNVTFFKGPYATIRYVVRRGFLWCQLPSGRCLAYGAPRVQDWPTPWGEKLPAVTVLGVDSTTRKWRRYALSRSVSIENVVQAIARDLMANGMLKAEAGGYPVVLSVHDEAVADTPIGHGTLHEYETLLCDLPPWAAGLPLVADGYEATRYRKD